MSGEEFKQAVRDIAHLDCEEAPSFDTFWEVAQEIDHWQSIDRDDIVTLLERLYWAVAGDYGE